MQVSVLTPGAAACDPYSLQLAPAPQYTQFVTDIRNFQPILYSFKEQLERALRHRRSRTAQACLEREACELIQDFSATLIECEEFLKQNRGVLQNRNSFIVNIFWNGGKRDQIEKLRSKVDFHMRKVSFFIAGLQLENSDRVLRATEESLLILRGGPTMALQESLPAWVEFRFHESVEKDADIPYTGDNNFPLDHGWEALCLHVDAGLMRPPNPHERTIYQYLSFAKAKWIIDQMKQSTAFRALPFGSYYTCAILAKEQLVIEEQRIDWPSFSEADYRALEDDAFKIWPARQIEPPANPEDPRDDEEIILEIPLQTSASMPKQNLIVLRREGNKTRVVHTVELANGTHYSEGIDMNPGAVRFIPLYALPSTRSQTSAMKVLLSGGMEFEMKTKRDLFDLQRAITNFQVASDIGSMRWALHRNFPLTNRDLQGQGRVQMWIWNPLDADEMRNNNPDESRRNSRASESMLSSDGSSISQSSNHTTATAATVLERTRTRNITDHHVSENEMYTAIRASINPVLLIFSAFENGYALLYARCKSPGTISTFPNLTFHSSTFRYRYRLLGL